MRVQVSKQVSRFSLRLFFSKNIVDDFFIKDFDILVFWNFFSFNGHFLLCHMALVICCMTHQLSLDECPLSLDDCDLFLDVCHLSLDMCHLY